MSYFWNINILMLVSIVACASGPSPIAEPISKNLNATTAGQVFSQGMVIDGGGHAYPKSGHPVPMNLFPVEVIKAVNALSANKSETIESKFLKTVCTDNGEVRYFPKETVKVIVPPPPKGVGLDEASKDRQEYLGNARKFLRERFFAMGRYNRFTVDRDGLNAKLAKNENMILNFFSLPGVSEAKIKDFYDEQSNQFALLVTGDAKGNATTYLVPNRFTKTKWQRESKNLNGWTVDGTKKGLGDSTTEKIVKPEVSDGLIPVNTPSMDRLASDRFVSLFVGMDRPWKLEDGNQFIALDVGELLDMAILDSKFTMILEPSLQEKYFKDADGNPEVCGTSDWCGFSKNKAFSPAKAMLDQSLLWDRYYRTFTDMTEAPSSADPSIIVFNLKLKMDVFCNDQHARAVSDLRSK